MKKAQQFTTVAKDLQEELKNTEIETTVRDGQVKVIMTAQQFPIKVEVSEELVKLGSEEVCCTIFFVICVVGSNCLDSYF